MHTKLLAVVVVAAAVFAGVASGGRAVSQQRIAISFGKGSDTFVLSPFGSGPVTRDAGSSSACCWSRRFSQRDGQAVEVDNPLNTFVGKRGTFTWRARVSFFDSGGGYYVSTGTWKIVRGTGAYKNLTGHGRLAGITDPRDQTLTLHAEGLLSLGG